ncbi:MAG TPA: DUF72 domain-containing protein [Polyangiaceae bacterium]|nr:DUF72 domain-containing protein [Polyangiaceae bacterium]
MTIRIGISGWRYAAWRGAFYPAGLPQRLELSYAAQRFPSIELNGSFYSLQRPEFFARWYGATPEEFVFAVKGPRFITHLRRLKEPATPLANFLASGLLNLRRKLGPILWQFPANLRYDRERFATFLSLLPRDTAGALGLARQRNRELMRGRTRLAIDENRPLCHAVEIRSESFLNDDFHSLLRQHGVALVISESAGRWPMPQELTADFVYLRLHGDAELYRSGYGDDALTRWADRIEAWHRGVAPSDAPRLGPGSAVHRARDVYCYFDNTDAKLRAPFDAEALIAKLRARSSDVAVSA